MRVLRRIAVFLLLLFAALSVAYVTLPWKSWLQHKLIAMLEKQGVAPVSFVVDGVGLRGITLKEIHVGDPAYQMDHLAFAYSAKALLTGDESSPLTLRSDTLSLRAGDTPVTIAHVELVLTRQGSFKAWRGTWRAEGIKIEDETFALPPLQGKGDLQVDPATLNVTGEFTNDANTHMAVGALEYSLNGEAASALTIREAKMPWGGGVVALTKTQVPIGGKKPVTLTLNVRKVNVESLLQALGAQGATATGAVSGSIPLTLMPNGKVKVGTGGLNAAEPGIITLPPETIPGENAQVSLVREVMKNLHYTVLGLSLASDSDGNLLVKLGVEGKNPDVENGRPVKLNVQLSGDLLDLLLQNIQLMSDPQTFIEQSGHETHD